MQALADSDTNRAILIFLATCVLFAVFAASAIAFVATLFNWYAPTELTRNYLFGLFAVSGVSVFIGVASNFLNPNPNEIKKTALREAAVDESRSTPAGAPDRKITVFAQISSADETRKFNAMKNTLPAARYIVPSVDVANVPISENQVRYCNDENRKDAVDVKQILDKHGFQPFEVKKIDDCSPEKTRNIIEVWLRHT